MKVYQVTMNYFDGDHDHGCYCSPLFATRELAEAFMEAVKSACGSYGYEWWTCDDYEDLEFLSIQELEVLDNWSRSQLKVSKKYLELTWH